MDDNIKRRVYTIDEVRGISIILMVIYHAFFDLTVVFGIQIPLYFSPMVQFLSVFFAGIFIFISGVVCHYSRDNVKRGVICFLFGMILTSITALIIKNEVIIFGILHMLGICMLLFPLLKSLIMKISPLVGMNICFLLWLVLYHVPDGYIGFKEFISISLPRELYDCKFLFWLGFPSDSFFSSDYFSIIPWIFCFYAGAFLGVLVKKQRMPAWFYRRHFNFLAFIGKHTLIIYLVHQIVIFGVLYFVFNFMK